MSLSLNSLYTLIIIPRERKPGSALPFKTNCERIGNMKFLIVRIASTRLVLRKFKWKRSLSRKFSSLKSETEGGGVLSGSNCPEDPHQSN